MAEGEIVDRLPLIGGSYSARSIIANCQRCVNLYPEGNSKDSPTPVTHYQRPGLVQLSLPTTSGRARFGYQASDGAAYAVVGATVYYIDTSYVWHSIGTLLTGNTPVSMQDNGIQVMLVDGSTRGYKWNLSDHGAATFATLTDENFTGGTRVDYIDTFLVWAIPGTKNFQSSLSNQIEPMDGTYIAAKTDYPDPLATLLVNRHELLLLGTQKSEIWYDAGNALFPFAELPGAYIEHGAAAKYSVASADIAAYWLGGDLQSGKQGMVFRQRGYETKRISNHALEYQMQLMAKTGTIADAVGSTYQQGGHVFYRLTFPTGNQTWIYDESIGDPMLAWSQRCWTDLQGRLQRDRAIFDFVVNGVNCALDWETGALYQLDPDTYTDTVASASGPITYIRTFPHLLAGVDVASGQTVLSQGRMVMHERFQLDAECGTSTDTDPAPQFTLRWSDNRGKTWGTDVLQSAGELGKYETRPNWRGLGQAMDRVYEVSWSFTGQCGLNGAWVQGKVLAQ